MRRYYRYGISAEKRIFEKHPDTCDGFVIPFHLALDQNASLPVFLKKSAKPFVVDPMTYALSEPRFSFLNKDRDGLRRSWQKLADVAMPPLDLEPNFLLNHRVEASHFLSLDQSENPRLNGFVDKILESQETLLQDDPGVSKYMKYASEVGADLDISDTSSLAGFTVPYFFCRPGDVWYDINIKMLKYAVNRNGEGNVRFVLALEDIESVTEDDIERIARDYSVASSGMIWIDDFDERLASVDQLEKYASLIESLYSRGCEVGAMYGSFFSVLLSSRGLNSVASGITYSEKKNRVQTGGGMIYPRYFNPMTLSFMTQSELVLYVGRFGIPCNCQYCTSEGISNLEDVEEYISHFFPNPRNDVEANMVALREHYMNAAAEVTEVLASTTPSQLVEMLEGEIGKVERYLRIRSPVVDHLKRWRDVINEDSLS